jgi:hypothetical protein
VPIPSPARLIRNRSGEAEFPGFRFSSSTVRASAVAGGRNLLISQHCHHGSRGRTLRVGAYLRSVNDGRVAK